MKRFLCIHGHFYQPPRENPWLESVELQDSAYPFHDWNARITAECYGPNATSRILEPGGRIVGIMNNYSRISFNMGPTLLSWLEEHEPVIYEAILEGDRESREIYGGHGCAIAQAYNHLIMPLANRRDKQTQILWGLEDFRHRFGRDPEGMWLAETAVDLETLDLLAANGIAYTILAPRQAAEVRNGESEEWHDVAHGRVDPRRPYRCALPSGREIALFFYDGPIAQDLAFGGILNSGEDLARRLVSAFDDEADDAQLVHVATDGETFGHHHKQGEMAISYCIYHLEKTKEARLTNYGEYLELHPPEWEARIFENSSWSCVHGVERWKSDCGCNSGMNPHWHQKWRAPLREALDWLRDKTIGFYEEEAARLLKDPWGARDRYIRVVLDPARESAAAFLEEEAGCPFTEPQAHRALTLLEVQRNAMLMYTSCGWFFDEISGIETTQVLRYAARVIQLMEKSGGGALEEGFLERLANAPSNLPSLGDGGRVYVKHVKPAEVDLLRVGMHYAVSSLFETAPEQVNVYCFDVDARTYERHHGGRLSLAIGRSRVRSRLTLESSDVSFAVLHLGDQNVSGGIRTYMAAEDFDAMAGEIRAAFRRSDIPEVMRLIDRHFRVQNFSLWHLFMDDQRRIMRAIFAEEERSLETFHRNVYRDHYPAMNAMGSMGIPLPRILQSTAEFVLNQDLRRTLSELPVDEAALEATLEEIRRFNVPVDRELLGYEGGGQLAGLSDRLATDPLDMEITQQMVDLLRQYRRLEVNLNLWYTQNAVYRIGLEQYAIRNYLAEAGDRAAAGWVELFRILCDAVGVSFPQ